MHFDQVWMLEPSSRLHPGLVATAAPLRSLLSLLLVLAGVQNQIHDIALQ